MFSLIFLQIRKQQKEHAELIEEYRVKQQQEQQRLQPGVIGPVQAMPGMQAQAPGIMPGGPPMGQPMMGLRMPMQQTHLGQSRPPRMPNMPGWHPGAVRPMGGPRMPPHMPPQIPLSTVGQPLQTQLPPPMDPGGKSGQPGAVAGGNGAGANIGGPHVKFDDNNPFSEGFQERERRERLREQQEKQRVQLLQEVERQRALQSFEIEHQGIGIGPDSSGDGLSQMPFFNSDLSQEFVQTPRPQQQLMGQVFPQPPNMPLDFVGSSPAFQHGGERRPVPGNSSFGPDMGPKFQSNNPALCGFPPGQSRPPGIERLGMSPYGGGDASSYSIDSTTPLPANFPGSGQSLIQLYSNIIPEEKGKKKRNRKKKRDDDADSMKTLSTPHSDLTAPLTLCVSDTSSTPTRTAAILGDQDASEFYNPTGSGIPLSAEQEKQLSGGALLRRQSSVGSEAERNGLLREIKMERLESSECQKTEGELAHSQSTAAGIIKMEENNEVISSIPTSQSEDTGNELLKHLLKNKNNPPPPPTHQLCNDSIRSEDESLGDRKSSLRLDSTKSLVRNILCL